MQLHIASLAVFILDWPPSMPEPHCDRISKILRLL